VIPISGILNRLTKKYKLENRIQEHKLRLQWKGIVGERIAAHTIPDRIHHHRLNLWVDSSIWKHQLTVLKPRLLQKINTVFNTPIFKDITFRTGQPPRTFGATQNIPQKTLTQRDDLTPEMELYIEAYLKPLGDLQLREVVRRTMVKSFMSLSVQD